MELLNSPGSISVLIAAAKNGDQVAAGQLCKRYEPRLRGLIQRHLRGVPQRAADADDVLQNVLLDFVRGAEEKQFPDLKNRNDLWHLLVVIASREAFNLRAYQSRAKRGGGEIRGESVFEKSGAEEPERGLEQVAGQDPTADEIAERLDAAESLLDKLPQSLRQVAVLKLDYTDKEIAAMLGCTVRTVERKVASIRAVWTGEQHP